MSYAVIASGGKQYVVHEGERLLVDRLPQDEGAVFEPVVLLVDAGSLNLKPGAGAVSARILRHTLGTKIRIGKYKAKKGDRRHSGFRAKLSQIQIEAIGAGKAPAAAKTATTTAAPAKHQAAEPVAPKPEAKAPAKPAAKPAAPKVAAAKAPAKSAAKKPAAKKPAATKAATKTPAKAKVEDAKKPAPRRAAPRKKTEQ